MTNQAHRIAIVGSRDWDDYPKFIEWMNYLCHPGVAFLPPPTDFIEDVCGCARGPDVFGKKWAEHYGIKVNKFPANWKKWPTQAGHIRNAEMADYLYGARHTAMPHCLAFWDQMSSGTMGMIKLVESRSIHTVIVNPYTGTVKQNFDWRQA